jgi:hypothetical protein
MSELIIHDYVDFSVSWPTIDELRVSGRDYRLYSLLEYVPFSKWWSRFKQQLTLTASSHYTCAIYLPNVFLPHAYVTWRQLILDIPFRPFGLMLPSTLNYLAFQFSILSVPDDDYSKNVLFSYLPILLCLIFVLPQSLS